MSRRVVRVHVPSKDLPATNDHPLYAALRDRTIEDLDGYAFEIGANPDDIAGDTVSAKARHLISWARAHGKLAALRKLAGLD